MLVATIDANLRCSLLQYGRHNVADVAKEIEGKTHEEVAEYSKVFWRRYKELGDWERIIKNIERGEQRIQRQQDIMSALAAKLERYRNPWQELRLQYGTNKGKAYTGEPSRHSHLYPCIAVSVAPWTHSAWSAAPYALWWHFVRTLAERTSRCRGGGPLHPLHGPQARLRSLGRAQGNDPRLLALPL